LSGRQDRRRRVRGALKPGGRAQGRSRVRFRLNLF